MRSNRRVLICGLGIAGPTLAYWLSRSVFEPVIVERSPGPRPGGYMMDFWGRGYDVAERMELLPCLHRLGYHMNELRLVDANGRRVGGFRADMFRAATDGRFTSIPRGDLARCLLGRLDDTVEMIFGDTIRTLHHDDDGVDVEFEHAAPRRFELVVGADGLHSTVRRLAFREQARFARYLGFMTAAFTARRLRAAR